VTRVLLGQPSGLLGGALAAMLSAQSGLLVVAVVSCTDEVPAAVVERRPHVAVLDGALPGEATLGELCRGLHRTAAGCHPLVLLDRQTGGGLGRSLAVLVPWLGLLATDAAPAELVRAVRRLVRGDPVLDPSLVSPVGSPLTERESEVLRLTGQGAAPKEIARRLDLSPGTVRNYLSRAVAKTGARTRLEAVRTARAAGWI